MAKLIYSAIASLDGYVADEHGNFDWSEAGRRGPPLRQRPRAADRDVSPRPPPLRGDGRLGEPQTFPDPSPVIRDFAAIWQAADKVVYSRTLERVSSARTRIERAFEPDACAR